MCQCCIHGMPAMKIVTNESFPRFFTSQKDSQERSIYRGVAAPSQAMLGGGYRTKPPPSRRFGTPPRLFRDFRVDAATRRFVPATSRAQFQRRAMETLVPNTNTLVGIAGFPGYDAAISTRKGKLWQAGGEDAQSMLRLVGVNYPCSALKHHKTQPGGWRDLCLLPIPCLGRASFA